MAHEHNYLGSDRLDELARMVTELASEVWILRDRNLVLEHLLASTGAVDPQELDGLRPEGEFAERVAGERDAFVSRVFGAILDPDTRTAAALGE
ncbi:hypothetical protein OG909_05690 [Streptomyces sp. NBC_01754]|uniref:hypothetical protein n=1 Tax=Streptomyces sp. NBC_01754 TaxID=2975930 RepID=UPI002DDC89C6|nr:hypothetical protein [Streptomyces sp. NBC_01754]WSC91820.1 hypothetical protein OG909_05690 [Streptomyces sp. NBC_01754]